MIKFKKLISVYLTLLLSINTYAVEDPFEDYNRKIWAFNEFLDDNFAKPSG